MITRTVHALSLREAREEAIYCPLARFLAAQRLHRQYSSRAVLRRKPGTLGEAEPAPWRRHTPPRQGEHGFVLPSPRLAVWGGVGLLVVALGAYGAWQSHQRTAERAERLQVDRDRAELRAAQARRGAVAAAAQADASARRQRAAQRRYQEAQEALDADTDPCLDRPVCPGRTDWWVRDAPATGGPDLPPAE